MSDTSTGPPRPAVAPSPDVFQADLDRHNIAFRRLGAVIDCGDGSYVIDEDKVPDTLLSSYSGLLQIGYANGLI